MLEPRGKRPPCAWSRSQVSTTRTAILTNGRQNCPCGQIDAAQERNLSHYAPKEVEEGLQALNGLDNWQDASKSVDAESQLIELLKTPIRFKGDSPDVHPASEMHLKSIG